MAKTARVRTVNTRPPGPLVPILLLRCSRHAVANPRTGTAAKIGTAAETNTAEKTSGEAKSAGASKTSSSTKSSGTAKTSQASRTTGSAKTAPASADDVTVDVSEDPCVQEHWLKLHREESVEHENLHLRRQRGGRQPVPRLLPASRLRPRRHRRMKFSFDCGCGEDLEGFGISREQLEVRPPLHSAHLPRTTPALPGESCFVTDEFLGCEPRCLGGVRSAAGDAKTAQSDSSGRGNTVGPSESARRRRRLRSRRFGELKQTLLQRFERDRQQSREDVSQAASSDDGGRSRETHPGRIHIIGLRTAGRRTR
jgi:hypothetical protein